MRDAGRCRNRTPPDPMSSSASASSGDSPNSFGVPDDHGGVFVPDVRPDARTTEPISESAAKTSTLSTTVPTTMSTNTVVATLNASCGRMPTDAASAGMPVAGWSRGSVNSVFGTLRLRNSGEVGSAIWSANSAGGVNASVCRGSQCLDDAFAPCVKDTSAGCRQLDKQGRAGTHCRGVLPTPSGRRRDLQIFVKTDHVRRRVDPQAKRGHCTDSMPRSVHHCVWNITSRIEGVPARNKPVNHGKLPHCARTETQQRRRVGESLAADGAGEHKAQALHARPDVAVHALPAPLPRGGEPRRADEQPVGDCEGDGHPEHDRSVSVHGRGGAQGRGVDDDARELPCGVGRVEHPYLRVERRELVRARERRAHRECEGPRRERTEGIVGVVADGGQRRRGAQRAAEGLRRRVWVQREREHRRRREERRCTAVRRVVAASGNTYTRTTGSC